MKGTTNAGVVPVQLTSVVTGNTLSVFDDEGNVVSGLEIQYSGTGITGTTTTAPTGIGSYQVQVVGTSGDYKNLSSAKVSYSIIGKSLSGATLYEVNAQNPNDVSDTTFTYNGAGQSIGVALNGAPLKTGITDDTGTADVDESLANEYTITYYNANGSQSLGSTAPTNAGTYRAVVTGVNDYAGSEIQLTFTIGKLNLSAADITLADVATTGATAPFTTELASVNGLADANVATISGLLDFDYEPAPTQAGTYKATIAPAAGNQTAQDNIEGTKTLSYNVVTSDEIYVEYGTGSSAAALGSSYPVDLSQGQSFNTGAISVYAGTDNTGDKLTSGQYTVTVTDQKGNTVPASSLATPGKWNVTVAVNSAAMDYALGGKATTTVTVTNGTIAANNIFVTYEGNAVQSLTRTYTGKNYLEDIAVKVVVGDKTLVEGTDYEVSCTDSKGDAVTEFTNAGSYKVTVTSDTWDISAAATAGTNVCPVTVSAVAPTALAVADQVTVDGQTGIAYTGSDITPAFQYQAVNEDGTPATKDGKPVMADLPASAYKIAKIELEQADGSYKEVESVKAAGSYKVTVAEASNEDNYSLAGIAAPIAFDVIDAKVFQDVPADAWYAQVVDQAAKNGYMGGYAGTKLFGPNDKITRAQVACVLFNMAGGDYNTGNDNSDSSNYGYVSFDDVKPGAYYAKAVAWAKDAGVVNGFAGTNNFGPDQVVTREQFACMLWNYAKAMLSPTVKDVDVAAALASKPDGAKVSGWAREGVAWAVQNKVMGNGGVIDPLATVTRAETAAMAVNFQPEFIKAAVTGITATAPTGNLAAGSTYDPQVAVTAKNGASTAFTARSSDEAVATVAADGEITAVAAGTATITYTTVGSTVNGAKLSTSIVVTVA